jgi:hypothetical protein
MLKVHLAAIFFVGSLPGMSLGQQLSPAHPSITLKNGTTITIAAITDTKLKQSWDYSGHRLPNMYLPNGVAPVRDLKSGMVVRYLIIKVKEPMIDGKGTSSLNLYRNSKLISTAGSEQISEAKLMTTESKFEVRLPRGFKTVDVVATLAQGPGKVIGEVKKSGGKVSRSGFDFKPMLVSEPSLDPANSDTYFVVAPPKNEGREIILNAFDSEGRPSTVGWSTDPAYPHEHPRPFGAGEVWRLQMSTRPFTRIVIRDIPLRPKK